MKKQLLAFAAVACSAAMLLAGCGSGKSSDANSDSAKTIISVYGSEPQNPLIPGNTNESGGGQILETLFSQLVSFDFDGNPQNEVAESITANEDATEYTIVLKDGWTFHDGTPVTSESFTKAWSYTANSANGFKGSSFFATILGYDAFQEDGLKGDEQLEGLKVVDDKTFVVTLSQPDATFPIKIGYSAFAPVPESFYADPESFGEHPIGNGPYKFDSWEHDAEINVVKYDDWAGDTEVKNDGISFKIYTSTDSAYADIEAGNLDVMAGIPSSASRTFQTNPNIQPYNEPGSIFQSFAIHCSNVAHFECGTEEGILRRQAISMAIDRDAIVENVLGGVGTAAIDFTAPLITGFSDSIEGNEVLKLNVEKAKELWAQAEAISPYTDTFTFSYNADGGAATLYDAIVNELKNNLGIAVETSPITTFQEFREAVTKRQLTNGAFRTGWMPDYPSPENYLFQLYATAAADNNGSNDSDYKNPEFDALLDQAYAAQTTEEANALYQESQKLLLRDLPAIPLYYSNNTGAAALNVTGFSINWQKMPVFTELSKTAA